MVLLWDDVDILIDFGKILSSGKVEFEHLHIKRGHFEHPHIFCVMNILVDGPDGHGQLKTNLKNVGLLLIRQNKHLARSATTWFKSFRFSFY